MSASAMDKPSLMLENQVSGGWPEKILVALPLLLFFPVALMYAGVLAFYLAWLCQRDPAVWRQRYQNLRQHTLLPAIIAMSAISLIAACWHGKPVHYSEDFWSGLAHYQVYLFVLPMLSLNPGVWQGRARQSLYLGSYIAATLFLLNYLQLLPATTLFRSYVEYKGNKSILLALLLALAAAWSLREFSARQESRCAHIWRGLGLLYLVLALCFLSRSRTALLIFLIMAAYWGLQQLRLRGVLGWKMAVLALLSSALLAAGLMSIARLPSPASCEIRTLQASPWEITQTRVICTVHQVRDFSAGRKLSEDGMRLEIYQHTASLIAQKPWAGHGIASWQGLYQTIAAGTSSASMTTPHNDYLLYWTELGVAGLLALGAIWLQQWRLARRMRASGSQELTLQADLLTMLTITMAVAASFNALLRDGLFAMAFMILLASVGVGSNPVLARRDNGAV